MMLIAASLLMVANLNMMIALIISWQTNRRSAQAQLEALDMRNRLLKDILDERRKSPERKLAEDLARRGDKTKGEGR